MRSRQRRQSRPPTDATNRLVEFLLPPKVPDAACNDSDRRKEEEQKDDEDQEQLEATRIADLACRQTMRTYAVPGAPACQVEQNDQGNNGNDENRGQQQGHERAKPQHGP